MAMTFWRDTAMNTRILAWDGCNNVRDLGGLPTGDGRLTLRGAVVRSDTPSRLSPAGWGALYACGIRTIVTLRTDGIPESELDVRPPFADIDVVRVAIEDFTDPEFVQQYVLTELVGTPLYYQDALQRWPERHAAAIAAIARARPGGVLFHCIRGYDRTGIIALLVLGLAGVTPGEIAADYELSRDPERDELLAARRTTTRDVIFSVLGGLEIDSYLRAGGARQADLDALRERLLGVGGQSSR